MASGPLQAHALGIGPGPGGLLGGFLGLIAAVIAAACLVARAKGAAAKTGNAAAGLVLAMAGTVGGALVGTMVDVAVMRHLWNKQMGDHEARELLPLNTAACSADLEAVQRILGTELDAPSRRHLGAVAFHCGGISRHWQTLRPTQEPANPMFVALMSRLHQLYRQGEPDQRMDYCEILGRIMAPDYLPRLRELRAAGLPLHCGGGTSTPTLKWLSGVRWDNEPEDAVPEFLALVSERDGFLAQARGGGDTTFLDMVIGQEAQFIEAGLRAGLDPHRAAPGRRSPAVTWLLHKHQTCANCVRLTRQQIAQVDTLLLPIPRHDLDSCARGHTPVVLELRRYSHGSDGGAAFLGEAIRLGADPGATACAGPAPRSGAFGGYDRTSGLRSDMRELLEGMPLPTLQRLARPMQPDGTAGRALVDQARADGLHELADVVCARLPGACQPERR